MHSKVRRGHGRAATSALLALTFAAAPVAAQSRVVLPAGSVILVRTTSPLQSATAQTGQTFEATVSRMDWRVEVKLDVPGMDPDVTADVVVLQPTALLRAGVIDLAPFALYGSADAAGGGASATIALEPVPLCIGEPFRGSVTIAAAPQRLQEIRLELRSKVEATVASGKDEQVTLWTGHVAGEGEFGGGSVTIPFDGVLATPWLPTSRLPHGKADAQFHVILAKAWAQDTHLVRDIAICSTTEL